MTSALSTGFQLGLLVLFVGLVLLRGRVSIVKRYSLPILVVFAVLGGLTHLDFFRFHHAGRGPAHFWEFYHYALGTKYFNELGYTGLYDATVVADFEDDRYNFNPDEWIRSLTTYEYVSRGDVIRNVEQVKLPFSQERWLEFKQDVATYREVHPPTWRAGTVLRDHGYNGSPLTTAILGFIADNSRLSGREFVRTNCWLDLLLIVATALVIAWSCNLEAGLVFFFLWSVNPLNDYTYIGGGFGRYMFFVALTLGVVAYFRGRRVLSGMAFAVTALLAVFPVVFVGALALNNLLSPRRLALIRERLPFYLSFVGTAVLLIAATFFLRSPDPRNVWAQFAENTQMHRAHFSPNIVGLVYPFIYSPEHNIREINRSFQAGEPRFWVEESKQTLRKRRGLYWMALAVALSWVLLYLRRAREEEVFLGALALLFVLLSLSHYYYCILSLLPFMAPRQALRQAAVLFLFLAVAALRFVPQMDVWDLKYCLVSLLMAAFFATVLHPSLARAPDTTPGDHDILGDLTPGTPS